MKSKLQSQSFSKVSDDELLLRLSEILQRSRRVESELVAHIGEVDQRRLYARYASSMFTYSTEVLHLSEHEAYLRIEVARASRKHPVLLEMLADGRLHLSGIALIHRHLTEANREMLLNRATHQTKRQIEELVAELSPKPDVQATMRKIPERRPKAKQTRSQLVPERVAPAMVETAFAPAPARPAVVSPLSPSRYKIQFTATAELRDKLERLEFHHLQPYGRGGGHDPSNVRLLCRTHNLYMAELDYGKDLMKRYRRFPNRVSEPAAVYTFSNRDTRTWTLGACTTLAE